MHAEQRRARFDLVGQATSDGAAHVLGAIPPQVPFQVGERFLKVDDKIIGGLRLDDHIVDVSFDVAAYLLIEA